MKYTFAAGMVVLAAALAAPSAKALTITTPYTSFSWTQGSTPIRNPSSLTFSTFNSLGAPANAILKNVWYTLASDANGSGAASVGGRIRVNNASSEESALISGATYNMKLQFNNGVQLTKADGATTSISCATSSVDCTQTGTGVTIPDGTASTNGSTDFVLNGVYSGQGSSFGLSGAALSQFQTGSTVSTVNSSLNNYLVAFTGQTTNGDTSFNYNGASINPKAFMSGFVALTYEYDVPAATVPSPLPLVGAAAAFGWSRRMRKRITSAV